MEDARKKVARKLCWTKLHQHVNLLSAPSGFMSVPTNMASHVQVRDSWGFTPLFYATLNCSEAVSALLCAGANPKLDSYILPWAVQAGAHTAISMLVRAGALVNTTDGNGTTALHWAALYRLQYCVNGLAVALELVRHAGHSVDWAAQNKIGKTPLSWAEKRAIRNPTDEDSKRILDLYRTRKLPDGAQYIPTPSIVDMEDKPVEDVDTGLPLTSLIRAGLLGDTEAVGDLIRRGAMVNEYDRERQTLLHLVALGKVPNGHRVALELVRHGGWGVDWDACTARGETALDIVRRRLEQDGLEDAIREEATNVRQLLRDRRLPPCEAYLWPCMDPDFYTLRMPGAWN